MASFGTETSGNTAISPVNAPGDHAACDVAIARLRERAVAAEAKLAEVRQTELPMFRMAQDLAEGIRQVLDREPLERSDEKEIQ